MLRLLQPCMGPYPKGLQNQGYHTISLWSHQIAAEDMGVVCFKNKLKLSLVFPLVLN